MTKLFKKFIAILLILSQVSGPFASLKIVEAANDDFFITFEVDNLVYTERYQSVVYALLREKYAEGELENAVTNFATTSHSDTNYNLLLKGSDFTRGTIYYPLGPSGLIYGVPYLYGAQDLWMSLHSDDRAGKTLYQPEDAYGISQATNDAYFTDMNIPEAREEPIYVAIWPAGVSYYDNNKPAGSDPDMFDPDEILGYYFVYVPEPGENDDVDVRTVYHKQKGVNYPLPRTFPAGTLPYYCADPVEVVSGNFIWEVTDLKIAGRNEMSFSRLYDNGIRKKGVMGRGFTHTFNYILEVDEQNAFFQLPNGEGIPFAYDEVSRQFKPSSDEQTNYTLSYSSGGLFGVQIEGSNEVYKSTYAKDGSIVKGIVYSLEDNKSADIESKQALEENILEEEVSDIEEESNTTEESPENLMEESDLNSDEYDDTDNTLSDSSNEEKNETEDTRNENILNQVDFTSVIKSIGLSESSILSTKESQNDSLASRESKIKATSDADGFKLVENTNAGDVLVSYDIEEYKPPVQRRTFGSRAFTPSGKVYIIKNNKEGTEYHFNENKQILKIKHNGEYLYTYEYAANDDLKKVISKDGGEFTFEMADGKITRVSDPSGNETKYFYTDELMTKSTNGDGDSLLFAYDKKNNLSSVTDFNGVKYLENTYDAKHRVTWQNISGMGAVTISYDDDRKVTTYTDTKGVKTNYYYDDTGDVKKVEKAGSSTENNFNDNSQVLSQKNPLGHTTKYGYDLFGRMNRVEYPDGSFVETEYNTNNLPISENHSGIFTIRYEYDSENNLISETDPNGGKTNYSYDKDNNLISETNALGETTTYSYDSNGFLESVTDSSGNTTTYEYDEVGKLKSISSPMGKETKYDYTKAGKLKSTNYADGTFEKYTNNGNGFLIKTENAAGYSEVIQRDTLSNPISEKDYEGNETKYSYDVAGNLQSVTDAMGFSDLRGYDSRNNLTSYKDNNGNTEKFTYDSNERILTHLNTFGGVTNFEYDSMDRIISAENPYGGTTIFGYDKLGRLTSEKNPLGYSNSYAYDNNGNMISSTDENGYKTEYSYDKLNRLVEVKDHEGNTTKTKYDAQGRVVEVSDSLNNIKSGYNADGDMLEFSDFENNKTAFDYTSDGRLKSETLPDGTKQEYEYDVLGNVTKITFADRTVQYDYNKNGQVIQITDSDGNESYVGY